jgi:hypothetical protein
VRALYDDLRAGIINCLANVEALIDFGEGEDFEAGVLEQGSYCLSTLIRSGLTTPQQDQRLETFLSPFKSISMINVEVRLFALGFGSSYLAPQMPEKAVSSIS